MLAANPAPTQFSCSSPSSHPPILSITAVADECSAFVWDCVVQIERVLHERRPELFHDIFSRELGPLTHLYVRPCSSCFLVKEAFVFFPFLCSDWRNSVCLPSNHRAQEQVPKHHPAVTTETHAAECHARTTTTKGQMTPQQKEHICIIHGDQKCRRFLMSCVISSPSFSDKQNRSSTEVPPFHVTSGHRAHLCR